MSRWGEAGPPPEAYERVTDADRFAPLHVHARELLADLERRFVVRRTEPADPAGPAVRLTPADPAAAALTVVFTSFPGLWVRYGLVELLPLPMCGRDACDEAVPDCMDVLLSRVDAITAGTHGSRLIRDGGWWHESWYLASTGEAGSSRTLVAAAELASLRERIPKGELIFAPWPS